MFADTQDLSVDLIDLRGEWKLLVADLLHFGHVDDLVAEDPKSLQRVGREGLDLFTEYAT